MCNEMPVWAKKVSPEKISRLYEQDAKGIYDDELVEDVGIGLYARCDSMIMVTSTNLGKAVCIKCRTLMPHSYQNDQVLICPQCGWSITLKDYTSSFKGKTLHGLGALPEIKEYVEKYPRVGTYAEKMKLIDFLIHTFHGNLSAEPSRPTATNVIEGNAGEVAKLIYDLAYGKDSIASLEAREEWKEKFNRSISRNIDFTTGRLKEGKRYLYDGIGKKKQ